MDAIILLGLLMLLGGGGGQTPDQPEELDEPPRDDQEPPPMPPAPDDVSPEQIRAIATSLGLDARWGDFLVAVAWGESRWKPRAINEGDASAARKGYRRATDDSWLTGCEIPADRWEIGSVGLYQLLPTSGMAAWRGTAFACRDPITTLQDPTLATIAAIQYARRVMGWRAWRDGPRTWQAMRNAWRAPGLADDDRPDIRDRFERALASVGLPASFADEKVTPLPSGFDPLQEAMTYVGE